MRLRRVHTVILTEKGKTTSFKENCKWMVSQSASFCHQVYNCGNESFWFREHVMFVKHQWLLKKAIEFCKIKLVKQISWTDLTKLTHNVKYIYLVYDSGPKSGSWPAKLDVLALCRYTSQTIGTIGLFRKWAMSLLLYQEGKHPFQSRHRIWIQHSRQVSMVN